MKYDDRETYSLWGSLVVLCGPWQSLNNFGGLWGSLAGPKWFWWSLGVFGGPWQSLNGFGGLWRSLAVLGGP